MLSSDDFIERNPQRALSRLRGEWVRNLESIQGKFTFGLLGGTPIEALYSAFNVDVVDMIGYSRYPAGAQMPKWYPRLRRCEGTNKYQLHVPVEKLVAHRNVVLASYLLRAHADLKLRWAFPDHAERKNVVWDEVDRQMFGAIPKFLHDLRAFRSLEEIHDGDIPLQLVGGYIAKHIQGASLESFYTSTPYWGISDGRVGFVRGQIERKLGAESSVDVLQSLPHFGGFTFHYPQVQHVARNVAKGMRRLFVGISRLHTEIVDPQTGDPLVAICKAVVWSCNAKEFSGLFSDRSLILQ